MIMNSNTYTHGFLSLTEKKSKTNAKNISSKNVVHHDVFCGS